MQAPPEYHPIPGVSLPVTPVTMVSDCVNTKDPRIPTRLLRVFGLVESLAKVEGEGRDYELAVAILEYLAGALGNGDLPREMRIPSVLLGNAAIRTDETHDTNGPEFGFCWIEDTVLLVTTLNDPVIALLREFGVAVTVRALDIRQVLGLGRDLYWPDLDVEACALDPFRSLKGLPHMALMQRWAQRLGIHVPSRPYRQPVAPIGERVGQVDEHGNCKTTIVMQVAKKFAEDGDEFVLTSPGVPSERRPPYRRVIPYYSELRKIPHGALGAYRDSVQYNGRALLCLAVMGFDGLTATQLTGLRAGDPIQLVAA